MTHNLFFYSLKISVITNTLTKTRLDTFHHQAASNCDTSFLLFSLTDMLWLLGSLADSWMVRAVQSFCPCFTANNVRRSSLNNLSDPARPYRLHNPLHFNLYTAFLGELA